MKKIYLVALVAVLLLVTTVGAEELNEQRGYAEESEIIPESVSWGLGFIGLVVGLLTIYFAWSVIQHTDKVLRLGIVWITLSGVLLALASVSCFFGWVSGLYSESVSVFIEDQLRLLALLSLLYGVYNIQRAVSHTASLAPKPKVLRPK